MTEEDGHVTRLRWDGAGRDETPVLRAAATQLASISQATPAVRPAARPAREPAQRRFLDALIAIPYGETRRYGDLARDLGISAQAAGQACGANPIAILIPCHRVLAADSLGGFSGPGGIETKVALLRLEGAASLLL